jgi:hypothetical protein
MAIVNPSPTFTEQHEKRIRDKAAWVEEHWDEIMADERKHSRRERKVSPKQRQARNREQQIIMEQAKILREQGWHLGRKTG